MQNRYRGVAVVCYSVVLWSVTLGDASILGIASPVHFTLLKKHGSKDSGFFSSVEIVILCGYFDDFYSEIITMC